MHILALFKLKLSFPIISLQKLALLLYEAASDGYVDPHQMETILGSIKTGTLRTQVFLVVNIRYIYQKHKTNCHLILTISLEKKLPQFLNLKLKIPFFRKMSKLLLLLCPNRLRLI